jgi:predicted aspartyl protease
MHGLKVALLGIPAAAALLSTGIAHGQGVGADCRLFVLKELGGDVIVDAVAVPPGGRVEITGEDIITFVLPFGPGQSGDVVQRDKGKATTIARCENGDLKVGVRLADGREREFPPVSLNDLAGYDVRVSVIGGNGSKNVFMIRGYADVQVASGPAIDMFGGVIPLGPNDYAVTSEVSLHEPLPPAFGEAALRFEKDLLLVTATLAGRSGPFIVDFGAGGTVVSHSALPPDTPIKKVTAIEYSADGRRELAGTMGGAGGEVAGFLGNAALDEVRIGDITFRDVTVRVIDRMPDFDGLEVMGILGLDLLGRGGVVTFGYHEGSKLIMTPGDSRLTAAADFIEVPFRLASKHIFLGASVDGHAADAILDTGARASILAEKLAVRAGVELSSETAREFKGLDGKPIPAKRATIRELELGGTSLGSAIFYAADLEVFSSFGLADSGMLLGNDFLRQHRAVRIDFERERIAFKR